MMTRKDFEAIAHTLNANMAPASLVLDFADMCEETNLNFDRARFVEAATPRLRANLEHDLKWIDREIFN